MDGLKTVKSDKTAVENIYSKIRRIFDHYAGEGEGQRQQAYQSLKADFEAKLQQALQQQGGAYMGAGIDVERQPQFQEEWRKTLARLDSQYIALLGEYKRELAVIAGAGGDRLGNESTETGEEDGFGAGFAGGSDSAVRLPAR